MKQPPRSPSAGLIGWRDGLGVLYVGLLMGLSALVLQSAPWWIPSLFSSTHSSEPMLQARTMAFSVLALAPLFHAFNARSLHASVFGRRLFENRLLWLGCGASAAVHLAAVAVPALHPVFRTVSMTPLQWAAVVGFAALPLPAVELAKWVARVVQVRDP
jgi:Ca2+-transporting ATPase